MKRLTAIRFAIDMNIQEKEMHRMSVVTLVILMILIPISVMLYVEGNYRMARVRKVLSVDIDRILVTDGIEGLGGIEKSEILAIDGVLGVGNFPDKDAFKYGNYWLTEAYPELVSYTEKNEKLRDNMDSNGYLCYFGMDTGLWRATNLPLSDGMLPDDCLLSIGAKAKSETETYWLLYLGEDYRGSVEVGNCRTIEYSNPLTKEKALLHYVVAGVLAKGAGVPSSKAYLDYKAWDETILLDSRILAVGVTGETLYDCCILIGDGASQSEVKGAVFDLMLEQNTAGKDMQIFGLDELYKDITAENSYFNSLLLRLLLALGITVMLLSVVRQSVSLISHSEEYGILYSCGATSRDVFRIVVYQNIMDMVLPLMIGLTSGGFIMNAMMNEKMKISFSTVGLYFKWIVPGMLVTAFVLAALSTIVPTIILRRLKPIAMLNNDF